MLPQLRNAVRFAAAVSTVSCGKCEPKALQATSPAVQPASDAPQGPESPAVLSAVATGFVPHDRTAFTQGLAFWQGRLFEGTGLRGQSAIRELDPDSGRELRRAELDASYFGEGITILNGRLYQLTWQEHTCLVYDVATFKQLAALAYDGEGWGLTDDGTSLITSDGSEWIRYRDPSSFKVTRSIRVTWSGQPIQRLNELEYIHGEIWANVWYTNTIMKISPADGHVVAVLDASKIVDGTPRSSDADDVLNGIAFDRASGSLLITGKRWPVIYKLEFPQ